MKIAIDVTPILPGGECGGLKQLVLELLRGFGKKAVSDSFILLTSSYNDEIFKEYEKYGMQRICVKKQGSTKKLSLWKRVVNKTKMNLGSYFRQGFLKENGISVLFCPMAAPTYSEAGIPTVSIICDLQHFYYPSFFSKQELVHRNIFYVQLKNKADYVVCISSFTKEKAIEKLALSPEKVFVIPICVHSRLSIPPHHFNDSVLEKFGLKGKQYCIYPANFWPHKNHKILLVAFNIFIKRHPDYDLHLVLTGEKIDSDRVFNDAVRQMGLVEKVHFLGYLTEGELSVVWQNSQFLIYPSFFEGFGIPLVEAMMYGKPILSSNFTSLPEVAGDAAIYFDPKKPDEIVSAICEIMKNEELYNLLVARGKERLKFYSFNSMVDSYIEILHKAGKEGTKIRHTEISGIYTDGWAGDFIRVIVSESRNKRTFNLKGFIPDWHKNDRMRIKIKDSFGKPKEYILKKKEVLDLRELIPEKSSMLDIQISGGFVPGGEDPRTLTFIVQEAEILDNGTGEKLYEFKRAE